jgi:23S rRNA pseudouridine2605 synthase
MVQTVRLQKVIAQSGLASRRAAEQLIRQGRVAVNGTTVTELGVRVDPERDEVCVDARRLRLEEPKVYLLFHKPKGCVTTLKDPQGRQTVVDFVGNIDARVYPVGRLDYDAEGLLLLTNDGVLAHKLQHPRYGVSKVYEVKVAGHPGEDTLQQLRSGVKLEEGITGPAGVEVLRLLPRACWLRIVLHQGWNRQIKRMCAVVGHPVVKIKRVAYGPLTLGRLTVGAFRPLTAQEVRALQAAASAQMAEAR